MSRHQLSQARTGWWLSAPAIVLMVIVLIVPVFLAALLSVTDYSLGNTSFGFVGVENYEKLFTRRTYEKMFSATLIYVLVVVPLSVALGLGAALLINSLRVGQSLYKTVYFLPVMASLIAMAIAWEFALHPTIGLVNKTLERGCEVDWLHSLLSGAWYGNEVASSWFARGCDSGFPLWLGDPDYALWVLCFIGVWQGFGFNMVLYLAGLTAIPRELYDACAVDGGRAALDRFRLVTWPLLGPTTVFVVTITSIRSFQVFDTVDALTLGGPAKSTYVMLYALFEKAIKQNLVGIGAAITVLFLAGVLVVTMVQRWLVERRVHYA